MQIDLSRAVSETSQNTALLALKKLRAMDEMTRWIDETTLKITGPVPLDEKLSWGSKETAARAVLADTATQAEASMISHEASVTGETLNDLATRIVGNADAYRTAIAILTGLRRDAAKTIDQATTSEQAFNAVQTAIQTAQTMLSQET